MAKDNLKSNQKITEIVNNNGCFDLQFRKDTRRERTNSPTYYRWKIQFAVTAPRENSGTMQKIKTAVGCGRVYLTDNQARFSAQKVSDIVGSIIPFFIKNSLAGNKKRNFELWRKAAGIIYGNKGKQISKWKKSDLFNLIEIHKAMAKYKSRSRKEKWLDMANTIARSIPVN